MHFVISSMLLQAAAAPIPAEGPNVVLKIAAGVGLVAILVICAVVMFLKSTGSSDAHDCGSCNNRCG
jgi:hypothetical protein